MKKLFGIGAAVLCSLVVLFTGCSSPSAPELTLDKIEITTQPTKKEYFVGAAALDLAGMKVTAIYSDGNTKDVTTEVTTSGFDSSKAVESQTITVTYGEKTATFTVKIIIVEVTKIEITTQPTKKEYYIGDSLDLTDMVVTATYNNGTTADVTKDAILSGFDSSAATESQAITVTYGGKSAGFTVKILFSWHETPKQLAAGTDGTYGTEGTYVYFGVWPQDVVPEADVAGLALDENATTTIERGSFKFVKGTDGNYYVKCAENANRTGYKYNKDNSDVGKGGTTSRWFKVMPIKWRVVDTKYDVDGTNGNSTAKLLVAENILTAKVPYYNYGSSSRTRTVGTKTGIYPNNYEFSQIRAYLNGLDYYYDTSDTDTTIINTYTNKGFLQTAFTSDAINKIITTKVDNREGSTTDVTGAIQKATTYACDPTDDKIFLLSEYEVTKYSKSTEAYNSYGTGNSRIRVTTDFAKANYAYQSTTNGFGGFWWLRSPSYYTSTAAHFVGNVGTAQSASDVSDAENGVVPALSISF